MKVERTQLSLTTADTRERRNLGARKVEASSERSHSNSDQSPREGDEGTRHKEEPPRHDPPQRDGCEYTKTLNITA